MNVNVNVLRLEQAATAAEQYAEVHRRRIAESTGVMDNLMTAWKGKDADQYSLLWGRLTGDGSDSQRMISAMDEYADRLRESARMYRAAQNAACGAARMIPSV